MLLSHFSGEESEATYLLVEIQGILESHEGRATRILKRPKQLCDLGQVSSALHSHFAQRPNSGLSQMTLEGPSSPGIARCQDSKPRPHPLHHLGGRWQQAGDMSMGAGLPLMLCRGLASLYSCFCFAVFDSGHSFQERRQRRKS